MIPHLEVAIKLAIVQISVPTGPVVNIYPYLPNRLIGDIRIKLGMLSNPHKLPTLKVDSAIHII
jgi:hypothetical protein